MIPKRMNHCSLQTTLLYNIYLNRFDHHTLYIYVQLMYNIAVQAHYITVQCTKYMVHEMQYANMKMSLLLFDVVVQ